MIIKKLKKKTIDNMLDDVNELMNLIIEDASKSDDPYVQYQLTLLKRRFEKTMSTAEKVTKK